MKFSVVMNPGYTVGRFKPKYARAQQWLDNEVIKDCDPYVPFRTGNLVRSGQRGTKIGSGVVVYNAPYARRCYYGNMTFNRMKHPKATREWFEKAKSACKGKWVSGVQKLMKG